MTASNMRVILVSAIQGLSLDPDGDDLEIDMLLCAPLQTFVSLSFASEEATTTFQVATSLVTRECEVEHSVGKADVEDHLGQGG